MSEQEILVQKYWDNTNKYLELMIEMTKIGKEGWKIVEEVNRAGYKIYNLCEQYPNEKYEELVTKYKKENPIGY